MSILSDIGTKIGASLKRQIDKVTSLNNTLMETKPNRYNPNNYLLGYRLDYYRAVVPLCEISSNDSSYTSGRFDFVRSNGCCSKLPLHVEIKMANAFDGSNVDTFIMHNNLPDNVRPCTFTKNGQQYGGLEVYYTVQGHYVYFIGSSTLEDLYLTKNVYWKYLDTRDDSVSDTEINDSLVIL
jgi:hypothetical protein